MHQRLKSLEKYTGQSSEKEAQVWKDTGAKLSDTTHRIYPAKLPDTTPGHPEGLPTSSGSVAFEQQSAGIIIPR